MYDLSIRNIIISKNIQNLFSFAEHKVTLPALYHFIEIFLRNVSIWDMSKKAQCVSSNLVRFLHSYYIGMYTKVFLRFHIRNKSLTNSDSISFVFRLQYFLISEQFASNIYPSLVTSVYVRRSKDLHRLNVPSERKGSRRDSVTKRFPRSEYPGCARKNFYNRKCEISFKNFH